MEQMRVQLQNKDDCIALRDQQLQKQSHFVTEFQKLLELKDHEKQHLQNNISVMTQEHLEQVTSLNYQINDKDKKLQQLSEELESTKAQLQQSQAQCEQCKKEHAAELQNLNDQFKRFQSKSQSDFAQKYQGTIDQLQTKTEESLALNKTISDQREQIQQLQTLLSQKSSAMSAMKKKFEADLRASEEYFTKKEKIIRDLNESFTCQQVAPNSPLNKKVAAEQQKLQTVIDQQQKIIEDLNQQLLDKTDTIQRLQKQRDNQEVVIKEKDGQIRIANDRVAELKKVPPDYNQKAFCELQVKVKEYREKEAKLYERIRTQQMTVASQQDIIKQLRIDCKTMEDEIELAQKHKNYVPQSPTRAPAESRRVMLLHKDQKLKQTMINSLRKQIEDLQTEQSFLLDRRAVSQVSKRPYQPLGGNFQLVGVQNLVKAK